MATGHPKRQKVELQVARFLQRERSKKVSDSARAILSQSKRLVTEAKDKSKPGKPA